MIKQIHLNECDSTQDILKEQLNQRVGAETILVSCNTQNMGRGRGENSWTSLPGSLCFSVSIKPNPVLSLTALEISVLVAKYFETKNQKLKLKWPNDLWTSEKIKCGGILVQGSKDLFMAGIGLNLFSEDKNFGGVFSEPLEIDHKTWAHEISEFILSHRLSSDELRGEWEKRCGHLNESVTITEALEAVAGKFLGIGPHGEARILTESGEKNLYNGSLRINGSL